MGAGAGNVEERDDCDELAVGPSQDINVDVCASIGSSLNADSGTSVGGVARGDDVNEDVVEMKSP
jgi:hypothetical protein